MVEDDVELASAIKDIRALGEPAQKEIRSLTGALLERMALASLAGISFNGLRRMYDILGYPLVITTADYKARYARGGIAGRVVDVMPDATWRGGVEIVEDENPKVSTPIEQAVKDLDKRLHLWATMRRVDKMAGLSTFAALLIGAKGGSLSEELPKGKKQEDVLYFSPYIGGGSPTAYRGGGVTGALDAACTVATWVEDIQDPRFGQPLTYQLRRTIFGTQALNQPVHWSRVIHIAENLLEDDVYGAPTLERVWNLLDDLDKVSGGGAEAFFMRVNKGLQIDIDKDVKGFSAAEEAALRQQVEDYTHQVARILKTRGTKITELGSDVANFANPADAILTQIAGSRAIPKRILTGSEMGELASSQDRENFRDQINGRQETYAGPFMVRPLIDRLITYGYLPTPKEYTVKFAHIQTLTETEKAAGAQQWAATNTAQGSPVFAGAEIRDHWYGFEPLTPKQIAEEQKVKAAGQPQPAATGETPFGKAKEPGAKDLLDPNPIADEEDPALKVAGGEGSGVPGHTTEGQPSWADQREKPPTAKERAQKREAEQTLNSILGGPKASAAVRKRANIDSLTKLKSIDLHRLATAYEAIARVTGQKSFALDTVKRELAKRVTTAEAHSYDSTQINLTGDLRSRMLALGQLIADTDLTEKGRERQPHVTVKYGLTDSKGLRDTLAGFGPVILTLGKVGIFSADDYDVVQVAVISPDLDRLNHLITEETENIDTHGTYMPHATVAYVQKGRGARYVGIDVGGTMVAHEIEFMPADDSSATTLSLRAAGDLEGHDFHGNQWTRRQWEKEGSFLSGPGEAHDLIANREKATVAAEDVRGVLERARKSNVTTDLTNLTIEGTPIFAGGLNLPRSSMPQIPKEHQAAFLEELGTHGIKVVRESVPPSTLLPTQNEISANRVGEKLKEYDSGKKDLRPILVSKDNKVLDGHHRWAVMAAIDAESPQLHVEIPVIRIMANHKTALKEMGDYTRSHKIANRALESEDAELIRVLEAAIVVGNQEVVAKLCGFATLGDLPGHPFHGNQFTDGHAREAHDHVEKAYNALATHAWTPLSKDAPAADLAADKILERNLISHAKDHIGQAQRATFRMKPEVGGPINTHLDTAVDHVDSGRLKEAATALADVRRALDKLRSQ